MLHWRPGGLFRSRTLPVSTPPGGALRRDRGGGDRSGLKPQALSLILTPSFSARSLVTMPLPRVGPFHTNLIPLIEVPATMVARGCQ
jgi:hypothetical protein